MGLKVLTKVTKHTGGLGRYDDCGTPEELTMAKYSGLMNYLFGPHRRKKMTKDAFLKFRGQMIDDILYMEFTRYCKSLPDLPNLSFPQHNPIITDVEVDDHVVDVIFLLLDDDRTGVLSIDNFTPLLAEWRLSRAFMQASMPGVGIIDLKLA